MRASSDAGSTSVHRALSGLYQSAPRSPGFWLGLANGKYQQKSDGRRGIRTLSLLPCQSRRFLCLKPQLLLRALSCSDSCNLLSSLGFRICSSPWETERGRKRRNQGWEDRERGVKGTCQSNLEYWSTSLHLGHYLFSTCVMNLYHVLFHV